MFVSAVTCVQVSSNRLVKREEGRDGMSCPMGSEAAGCCGVVVQHKC